MMANDDFAVLDRAATAISRRSFVGWMIASIPVAGGIRVALLTPSPQVALNEEVLLSLAASILPGELRDEELTRVVEEFQMWVRGYRAGAERNHGYGTARIVFTGASPVQRWELQLRTLDADAMRLRNVAFRALPAADRREIVRDQLAQERAGAIPGDIAGAQHVALALLASFYTSSHATDICYGALIQRQSCRALDQSPRRPLPLQRTGAE